MPAKTSAALRPPWEEPARWLREPLYAWAFRSGLRRHQDVSGRSIVPTAGTPPGAPDEELWARLGRQARPRVRRVKVDLAGKAGDLPREYWKRFGVHYARIGAAREKALEHALSFELLDFSRVRRYCDVASAKSPIEKALGEDYPRVESFRQDLLYETDLRRRIVGGFAQDMAEIADGFFDALTLHCSFEHFFGSADQEFLPEVDRVLSARGACLILPLYLAGTHCVYFDPTVVNPGGLEGYDDEAELRAAWHYRQEHGRFYSPEALDERLLARLPGGLQVTLLRFLGGGSVHPSVYLRFGMVLHRSESILTL